MAAHSGAAALSGGNSGIPFVAEDGSPFLAEDSTPLVTEGGSSGGLLAAGMLLARGSAALSGSGTAAAAGSVAGPGAGSAALAGAGTLAAAGRRVPGGTGAFLFAAPVLSGGPRIIKNAAAAWSAATALTAAGSVPAMLARPALSATAKVTHPGAAALHAAPALAAASSSSAAHLAAAPALLAPGRMAAARFLAGTALTASGRYFLPGQASLAAAAHLGAAAKVTEPAAAHLAASPVLAPAVLVRTAGAAALSGAAHLTAAPSSAAVHLAAAPGLAAAAAVTGRAVAALHAPGTASAAARVTQRAGAALSAVPALASQGVVSRRAAGILGASPALHAAGTRVVAGRAALAAPGAVAARGARTAAAAAALSGAPALHSAGTVFPAARLHASPVLHGAGTAGRPGAAVLSAGAHLSGTAHGVTFPRAAWAAYGVLLPTPLGVVRATAAFSASPSALAVAVTGPKVPFPVRPARQQPAWQRDTQRFAVVQERQRHAQALWQYGELVFFALMWRPEDISAGLARRCTRCYAPARTLDTLPPGTTAPPGWPTPAAESQISAAYGQGSQFRCTLCYGTQVIAAGSVQVPGVRALLARPAILADTDQNQQRSAKGVLNTGSVSVQTTPDFRVSTLDYFFRADGRRYQLQVPARTTLRTGFGSPWQGAAAVSYNLASAALEDPQASAAYLIPPSRADLARILGTYTRLPADFAWAEQVNGPLVPGEEPSPAASGLYQPPARLGV